jgi:hypothetical protein
MTTADLDRIGQELNLVLPRSYREFMQNGKFGDSDDGPQELTGGADEVIKLTKDARKQGFYGATWPDNYLVIGDDGAGDYYFTDVQKERPAVFFADHELTTIKKKLVVSVEEQYETFSAFWKFIEEMAADTEEHIQRSVSSRQVKRWWQFWIK